MEYQVEYQVQELNDGRNHMTAGILTKVARTRAANGHAEPEVQDKPVERFSTSANASLIRVLIVEDNSEIRMMMSLVLEERCDVDAVGSFDAALDHLENDDYDVAFIDIDLGEHRTGVDLVKRLHHSGQDEDVSLVACTAYAMPGDRERFLSEGFDHYIGKPFTEKDLLNALEKARHPGSA